MALSRNAIEQIVSEIRRLIEITDGHGLDTTVRLFEMARLDVITHLSDAEADAFFSRPEKSQPIH